MLITVVKTNTNDNKSIVSEEKRQKNQTIQKFYLTDSENVDKFIKTKERNNFSDKFQRGLSLLCSTAIGFLVGVNTRSSNLFVKASTGFVSALGTLVGLSVVDKSLDKWANKQLMKKYKVQEITKEDAIKLTQQETQQEEQPDTKEAE